MATSVNSTQNCSCFQVIDLVGKTMIAVGIATIVAGVTTIGIGAKENNSQLKEAGFILGACGLIAFSIGNALSYSAMKTKEKISEMTPLILFNGSS